MRAITGATGGLAERRVYHPFGEMQAWDYDVATAEDAHGFIGERYDASTGLQYLNARYYDVRLGMFIQPDWYEVTEPHIIPPCSSPPSP